MKSFLASSFLIFYKNTFQVKLFIIFLNNVLIYLNSLFFYTNKETTHPLGHQMAWKPRGCVGMVVRNDHVKGFFAPLKPKLDTAPSMFDFYTKSNKYRYTNNAKVMRCISLRFERC